ncbi:MAG: hypothetical protein AB7F99_12310 [Vicinamibacterales bacterium]
MNTPDEAAAAAPYEEFLEAISQFSTVLAIKLYRVRLRTHPSVPTLPCLDHEAMLHEEVAPHLTAYIQDAGGDLHEVTFTPDERRIGVDVVSTLGERSDEAHTRLVAALRRRFPDTQLRISRPSWIRGDLRVAKACRAQVALRDVLVGDDLDGTKAAVDRLQTISSLMEKESRVASWASRTVMTPLIAFAGFLSYQVLATLNLPAGLEWIASLRYGVVGVLGAYFLYYGLKAVQLTEMANRVWKRSAEYGLILSERRRLSRPRAIVSRAEPSVSRPGGAS